jgi:hypothetical protein
MAAAAVNESDDEINYKSQKGGIDKQQELWLEDQEKL